MQKSYALTDGTSLTIAAMTPSVVAKAVRDLNKSRPSQRITGLDTDLERNLEFKVTMANKVLVSANVNGSDLNPANRVLWLEETPGALDFVLAKAEEQKTEAAKLFEVEEKNS